MTSIQIFDKFLPTQEEQIEIISSEEIMQMLPHKGSAIMLDEARIIESDNRIIATYHLSPFNPAFEGHFPQAPILKGVLHIEIAAQAAILLVKKMYPEITGLPYLSGIGSVRFKRKVFAGDTITIIVTLMHYHKDNPKSHPFEFSFTIAKKVGDMNKEVSSGSFEGVVDRS